LTRLKGGTAVARNVVRFLSVLFVALCLAPALAHLLELPNKIYMAREQYHTVQQIYRGWALLGVVIYAALFLTFGLAVVSRRSRAAFRWAVVAFVALAAAQGVFWTWTYPANRATDNWSTLPENWEQLRARWEYSHAAGAGLNLVAMVAVILAALPPAEGRDRAADEEAGGPGW
jgi:hypothetical protein